MLHLDVDFGFAKTLAASSSSNLPCNSSRVETISWWQNLIYVLSLDKNFVPFLDATWQKQTATNPHRGLTNDGTISWTSATYCHPKECPSGRTAQPNSQPLSLISRNSIVKHSTSLNDIWQKIRQYYGYY